MKKNLNKILILFFATLTIGFSQNNYSLSFDGVDDYVKISSGDDFNVSDDQELTISAYVKTNENGYLFNAEFSFGYYFYISQSSELALWYNGTGNGCGANTDIRDGNWHHVVASYDGNSIKIYIDGQLDNNCENMGSLESRDGSIDITIGNRPGSTHFNGGIDEVSIWNKALTQEQIENTIQVELNGDEDGLIGYWNFNDGQGSTLTDLSGSDNDGIIYGATWSGDGAPVEAPVLGCTDIYAENYDSEANSDDGSCSGYPDNGQFSLSFDGIDDWVDITNSSTLNVSGSELTIIAKAKVEGFPSMSGGNCSHTAIISKTNSQSPYGGYGIISNQSQSKWIYALGSQNSNSWNEVYANSSFLMNEFQLLAGTFNGNEGTAKFFVDNSFETENGFFTGPIRSVNDNVFLGKNPQSDDYCYFNGSIDELVVIKKELLESEIIGFEDYITSNNENILAHYKFNAGNGDILFDHSGNQNHGSINGATWEEVISGCTDPYAENYDPEANSDDGSCYYPDNGEYVLSFNGSGDHVNFGTDPSTELSGDITLAAWIKFDNFNNNNACVISKVSDGSPIAYGIEKKNSQNKISFWIGDGNSFNEVFSPELSVDTWYFITGTNDGSTSKLYIDGQFITSAPSGYPAGPTGDLKIGIHSLLSTGGRYWDGSIDNVSIWDIVLTDEEIDNLSQSSPIGDEEGLVAYWSFNSGDGEILYDHSGNQNHGTIVGATWEEVISGCTDPYAENYASEANSDDGSCSGYPDEENNSLFFSNNNVSVENIGDYSSKVTIMAWIKKDGSDSYSDIISGGCGNLLFTEHQNRLLFGSQCGNPISHDTYSTTEITDNIWHHVAATYNANGGSNNLKVYVDGQLEGQSTKTAYFNVDDFKIGTNNDGDGEFFNGYMDMMRIWNIDLTQEEIQENMNSDVPTINYGLLSDWRFNSGNGNMAFDHSGNGNHGSINGPTWNDDVPVLPVPPVIGGNNSLSFDGVDDYVKLSQDAFSGEFGTLMAWFYPETNLNNTSDSGKPIYCQGASTTTWATFAVGLRPNSIWLEMGAQDQIELTYGSFNYDQWNHIAVSFDNGWVNTYINGSHVSRVQASSSTISNNDEGSFIGRRGNTNNVNENYSFQGMISNFSAVPYVLNRNDILISMTMMIGDYSIFSGSNWNFNEGEDEILTDFGEIGNMGTIFGATWSGDAPAPLIVGCTDPYAENYDPNATINDRLCYGYPENGEYSLSFGESQDHVDLGSNMDSDEHFSIATWVYIDENIIPLNGQRTFINKVNSSNGDKSIFLGSYQSKIGFTVLTGEQSNIMYGSNNQNGSLGFTETPLVPGWQHIGAVFTGDSMLVYINGELDANVVVFQNPGSVNDYDNSVWHMADVLGGSGNVGGKISSMSLWSKPLQQYDIQNLMSESPDPLSAGLMGMWKFAEGEGSLLHDHSGNGNHGTITGATWSDDVPYVGPEWFVSISGNDSNIGSQDEPFATIQHGINAAHNGHIVLVSPGTYTENINFNGRNILVVSEMGPSETIIDGGQNGSVVTFNSGETDGAALDGFTITNGLTENGNGGGIFIDNSSPSIFNVIVENNHANSGGGIDLKGETQTVISNSIVRDNSAEWGAGIYCHSNSPTIENVVVSGNHATVNAGGVYAREYASPIIINCTIVNNSTDGQGGGILTWFNSTVDVKNSIIRDNYPNELGHVSGGSVTLNYSNISGNHEGFSGSNNINVDPMFCNQSNNDFRITEDSPCFGAGESGIDIGAMFDGDYCEESFVNNSLTFNGVDDYVQINNDYDFIDSLSILFWVKPFEQDLNGGQITILQRSNAFGFRYTQNSENNFILDYVINGILPYNWNSTGITLNKDEWNFISFIVDNNSIKVYHNNQIEYELDGISGEITETAWPYIQVGNEAGESLYGSFDEFSIWDISLSSEMIKEAYQSSFSGNEEGLVGYWNFNGGEGSTLIDLSGNGNDGIINGASWDNYGAPIGPTGGEDNEPNINGRLSGIISASSNNALLEGAHIIAISEDNSFSAEAYSDINGAYSLDLVGSLNYFVNISYEGLVDHNEYLYVAPFEEASLNVSLNVLEDAIVEGTVTDWYTNTPLASASVLLAYTDEEMETIESMTDENGYFMVQVPGEKDYDLFVYADGYWVEHDAFFLSSGSQQEITVGIAEMSSASRLYGTIKDIETNELIPYAEIQLNCDQASDWDHTGALGTYRLFNYYSGDCDDGVLIVSASGYETSVQSASDIAFEAGSSYEMDITLMQGDDPDPGMISGTVFSNIDQSTIAAATINAYNVNTTQLFSIETSEEGSYQLFLPESEYYISITANNHEEFLDTLSVVSGQSFTRDFYLDEVYLNTVSGIVADPNGNGLFDMEVFVAPEGERYTIASTFTNESGEYTVQVPNGRYDFGAGNTNYYMTFEYSVELSGSDQNIDFTLTPVAQFDGGFAGLVHLNEGDNSTVWLNIWNSDLTYQAYVSSDENGAYTLPLINGTYSLYAWVPGSNYQSVYVPNAFMIEDNVINYDIYFVAPDAPEPPTIVFLEDVPNDQGGQLELAWTPGDPREYEIFPQYSIWRMDEEWNLISTVPYRGSDVYSMVVPTLGDSTQEGIFESTFMVTAHTINENIFYDSDPVTSYSIDNIFPGIPQQLVASFSGEVVDLDWVHSEAEDLSHYNLYRQNVIIGGSATIISTEDNYYSDNVNQSGEFEYWVTAVDVSGNESDPSNAAMVTLGVEEEMIPMEFALLQNYPNPFNPSTQIMYTLPNTSAVEIVIYDMLGSKVRTLFSGSQDAGYKNVLWNATNEKGDPVSAGMYIYTIEANGFFASKKMILLK